MRGRTVAMIGEQRGAILTLLDAVRDEGWAAPTPCEGWSVADVVAHLVEGELAFGPLLRGEVSEQGFVDLTAIDRWRALPPEAVRAALWQHGTANQRVLDGMDDARWAAPVRAFGCRRISQLARLGLFEAIVHGHDLAEGLGAHPIWGNRIGFAVEHVLRAAPATLARHDAAPATVEIHAGPSRRELAFDGGWVLREASGTARASITIEAADLVLATTGRMSVEHALGRASVDGEAATAATLLTDWQVVAP